MIPKVRIYGQIVTLLWLLLSCPTFALAETWYVDDDNCPLPGSGTPVDPFCTIGQGIAAAISGDTVEVGDGYYTGLGNRDLDFAGKPITVQSKNGPENCVIDCEASELDPHRAFVIPGGEAVSIRGLTIVNGYAPEGRGGAIYAVDSGITIADCVFENNHAVALTGVEFDGLGGAIYVSGDGSPLIEGCEFWSNTVTAALETRRTGHGGAVFVGTGSEAAIRNCRFVANTASSGNKPYTGNGGAIRNIGGELDVRNCFFLRNEATRLGTLGGSAGAVASRGTFGDFLGGGLVVEDCEFVHNAADHVGGAISGIPKTNRFAITRCSFVGNSALTHGGAVWTQNGRIRVASSVFAGNSSNGAAAALVNFPDLGEGAKFTNCVIVGNETTGEACGGIGYLGAEDQELRIRDCTLVANRGGRGALANSADFVDLYGPGILSVSNSIVYWNSPIQIAADPGVITTVTYSCIQYGEGESWFGTGCIEYDPMFVDIPGGQFTAAAVYDDETGQTTFTDANADWECNELVGLFLNPDTIQMLQSFIVSNTETQVTVWGDFSDVGPANAIYQIHDYRLMTTSPAVDEGNSSSLPLDDLDLDGDGDLAELVPMDFDGFPRVLCGQVDMGATELGIGDFDCNDVVDLLDFHHWPNCMNGFDGIYTAGCESFEYAFDENINLEDFAGLQRRWSINE